MAVGFINYLQIEPATASDTSTTLQPWTVGLLDNCELGRSSCDSSIMLTLCKLPHLCYGQSQLVQSTPLDIKGINTPCRHIPTNSCTCMQQGTQLQHQSTYSAPHAGTLTCPKTAPASEHSNALKSAPQQAHSPTLSHMPKQQLQHLASTLTCSNKHQSTNVHSTLPCPNSSSRAQSCT